MAGIMAASGWRHQDEGLSLGAQFRSRFSNTHLMVAVGILVVALAITVGTSIAARSHFRSLSEDEFEHAVLTAAAAIEKSVSEKLVILQSIQGLFATRDDVTRDQFDSFVMLLARDDSAIQALEWIPRIERDALDAYVRRTQAEGFADFALHPAGERDVYFPVDYVFPMDPNRAAFGFDLASNPERLAALNESRDTGKLVATAPITLVQETGSQAGFLVFAPVYRGGGVPSTVAERRDKLAGFGLAVFRVGDFIDNSVPAPSQEEFNLVVFDTLVSDDTKIHAATDAHRGLLEADALLIQRELDVAGRTWVLCFLVPRGFGLGALSQSAWLLILVAGSLVSLLGFGFSFLLLTGRDRAIALAGRMNESLAASESQRDQMFELSQDLIITADAQGNFVFVSEASRRLLGRDPADMVGKPYLDFVHPEDRASVARAAAQVVEGDELTAFDCRFLRADGEAVWLSWNAHWLPGLVFAVGRDVTERREIERMKDEFVATVSHELRTPVTSIKGFLEMLTDDLDASMGEEQRSYLQAAGRNAERMERLVSDLLDLSSLEAGRLAVEPALFDLRSAVNDVLSALQPDLEERTIDVTIEIPEVPTPQAWGDQRRVEQVLTNLLSNAVKYSQPGARIEVVVASGDEGDDPSMLRVEVRDNGIGIPPEAIEHLFEKFYRVDNSSTRSSTGTGLGLAISKALVELLGGRLWVESELGRGSTFSFTLPRGAADAHGPA